MNISLFWDKTFVVRPTSDLKKLKFMKMGQKSPKYPPGALFGGPTKKKFFQKVSTHKYKPFLGQKFCSKIKNYKLLYEK